MRTLKQRIFAESQILLENENRKYLNRWRNPEPPVLVVNMFYDDILKTPIGGNTKEICEKLVNRKRSLIKHGYIEIKNGIETPTQKGLEKLKNHLKSA